MRTYERSGITVDQCTECRGIFLDRGELERLVDAEVAFNAPASAPLQQQPRYEERKYDKDRRDDRSYGNQQYPRKKKKSFFEELFD
ncbi:hypothetical protein F1D05_19515 [Kribbella qitaiheensis]|uniref:Transcription factor zinc-finger domain-containing protein n=1 Tax=Kribbella qitaiheensis TaxID=1544730 RepID=A0A7G6X0E5_9ACTN|nr:zf-TFIIB domain-containing protein [Kribbella qitaiheensis]QNE19710.1 hypothetical protein F1D05_19515 [Kribbella qitaiheensis]